MSEQAVLNGTALAATGAQCPPQPARRFAILMLALVGALLFLALGRPTAVQAATITVDGTTCTLINAIAAANTDAVAGSCTAGSGADTLVLVSNSTHTLSNFNNTSSDSIRNGLPQITSAITIDGNNAAIVRPTATATGFRIFYVASTGALTLNNLTVQGGSIQGNGGGIANVGGNVTLNNVTLVSNAAKRTTGSGGGGGLYSSGGNVTLNNSYVHGSLGGNINVAGGTLMVSSSTIYSGIDTGEGTCGGIFIANTLVTMDNSTVSGNVSGTSNTTNKAGGITITGTGSLTIKDSTVTGNSTVNNGGGISLNGATGTLTLERSLIAGNSATNGREIYNNGGAVTSNNYNLFGHSGQTTAQAISGFTPSGTDRTATSNGTTATALSSILNTALANNGGATLTHALVTGSPALDAAGATGPATDQRGITRPQGSAFDIGAFEVEQTTSNQAPVAVNDSYTTNQDTQLIVPSPTVLDNDSDADNDPLTAVLVSNASHGSVTLNANGSFSYTPNGGFTGSDSFTYKANDGTADSNEATVTITVIDTNDAPEANDDSYATDEDTLLSVTAPGLLDNDTDAESNPLNAALVGNVSHGTVTVNPDGSFSYTPAVDYCGSDSFSYKANDSQADSNTAVVLITVNCVNDAPTATADSYNTAEDSPLTVVAPGVLDNDSDVENNALTAVLVSGPSHGTLTLNSDGSFTYTPATDFNGADSFTYKSNDGAADSNQATVDITISAVNDAPTAAADSYNTGEDTALTVPAPGVLDNDSDLDGDSLTATLVDLPTHGTVTLNADGSFTYTPAANYNGADSFTYQANDGTADSNVVTVSLTVAAVNDAPDANADSYATDEDATLTEAASGVLSNDTDADGDNLTAILVSGPSHGTLTLNADGSFTYTPATNYSGNDSFSYQANDGASASTSVNVLIVVGGVNDAPVANNDSYSTNEDTALTVAAPGVLANDSDEEGDALTATLVDLPSHGTVTLNADGAFTYTPAADYSGADSFTYQAADAQLNSNIATVNLQVNAINDAPLASDDSYSSNENTPLTIAAPGVLENDTDAEGSALSAVLVSGPSHGTLTLNADGSFTYSPAANFNGNDSFTYRANDGGANSSPATVSIVVAAVNSAPVAEDDSYSTNENTPLLVGTPGVLSNDSDVDSSGLTAVLISNPAHGTVTLNANGSFAYTPVANYSGADSFTYVANDGQVDSNVATVNLTVNPLNATVGTCGGFTVLQNPNGSYRAAGWSGNVIVGTNGWNIIIGSNSADLILGRGGPDDILGLKGNDIICGGDGVDIILGGDGTDKLYGDEHPDWLIGGSDNDTLYGGNGWDDLEGNDGMDVIYGEEGFDVLLGGNQNDTLAGGDGPDYLAGDGGVDNLSGGPGPDALFGGNDNDTLNGNDGDDELYGNQGNDTLNGGTNSDYCLGGPGTDTIAQCEGASAASVEDDAAADKTGEAEPTKLNDADGANAIEWRVNQLFFPMIDK